MEPCDAWRRLRATKNHRLVDTHGHPHLEREEASAVYRMQLPAESDDDEVIALTCAVEPADWDACLKYASQSTNRMAALGIHPWYVGGIANDADDQWLVDLEHLLRIHPGCMVGEIGLCKVARFVRRYADGKQAALALQRRVFVKQLCLAAKYRRPVSIHCVGLHAVLLESFLEQSSLPPTVALHSFSGTAHQVNQLIRWEESLQLAEPLLYFGFSHSVNYAMCTSAKSRRQGRDAVRQVPRDRLLAESDVHAEKTVALGTAGAIAYMSWALDEQIEDMADVTTRNGLCFLKRLQVGMTV